jgi:hypothetical protein
MEQPEKASWFNLHTKRFEQVKPHDDTPSLSLSLSLSLVRPGATEVHKYCQLWLPLSPSKIQSAGIDQ